MRKLRQRLAAIAMCAVFLPYWVVLQPAVGATASGSASGGSTPGTPINLNLSSTSNSVPASSLVGSSPVHIRVGAGVHSVSSGQSLTPAEWLAVYQVVHGGVQRLVVGADGAAVGGTAVANQQLNPLISSLTIPKGVTVIDRTAVLNLTGNLTDSGRLYAAAAGPGLTISSIIANNIIVSSGGLLSSVLPASTLFSGSERATKLGLILTAANDISNAGTINSSGALSLNAGRSITNALTQESSRGVKPIIRAAGDVNLSAGSGEITNGGSVISMNGAINIAAGSPSTDLNINAAGGKFQALAGAIKLGNPSAASTSNLTVTGGDFLSKELNLNSGQGTIEAAFGKVTGTVNVGAGAAHIFADTRKLVLGQTTVNGDPTYVNAGGDIQLVGTETETADLAIIASGNINASGSAQIVDNGHNVWLIAGASVNATNGSCVGCGNSGTALTLPAGTATPISSGYVQVTASGGAGGNIDLQTNNSLGAGQTVIDTSGATAGASGGNVNLVAIANGTTGGKILFPTAAAVTSINTSGNTTGSNGNVNVYAGASNGQGISLSGITTNGGSGTAANVNINTAQAAFSGGAGCASCISFDSAGTATGSVSTSAPVNSTAIFTGPIAAGSGTVTIHAGGITTQIAAPISANTVNLSTTTGSNGNISLGADITATNSASLQADGSGTVTDLPNLIASIPVGIFPEQTTVNTAGTFAYVTNVDSSTVSVINTATNLVVSTISLAAKPIAIALNPAGTYAYVTTAASVVAVIDTASNSIVATISVGSNPTAIAINPAGTVAYVANQSSNSISVIDTTSNAVVATISLPMSPRAIAFNPSSATAYVIGPSYVGYIISPSSNAIINTFSLPYLGYGGLAFNATGTVAYAATQSQVALINTATNGTVKNIGNFSTVAVGLDPAGSQTYLVTSDRTMVYNSASNSYTSFVGAGSTTVNGSKFVGFVGNDATAYIPDQVNNAVSVIATAAIVSKNISLTSGSGDIAVGVGGTPTVTVTTAGNANITANGALTIAASTVGGSFVAPASGAVSTSGTISAGAINFSSGNGGNVSIAANLTGTNGITLSAAGSGVLTIPNLVSLNSTNSNITLTGALNLSPGMIVNAGTGTVALQPGPSMTVGLNGGAGAFSVTQALMNTISAGTLQIGSLMSGALTQAGTFNESGAAAPGVFNLVLVSGDTFTGSGSTTTLGARSLTIDSLGTASIGTINGSANAAVTITGGNVVLNNDVALGATSTATFNLHPLTGAGSFTQNAGTISGSTVAFNYSPVTVGEFTNLANINISANTLAINGNFSNVSINNSSGTAITIGAASINGNFTFSSNGPINGGTVTLLGTATISTTNGGIGVGQLNAGTISLTAAGSGSITGSMTGEGSVSLITGSGDVNVQTTSYNITVGTTGNVTINNAPTWGANTTTLSSTGTTFSSLIFNNSTNSPGGNGWLSIATPLNSETTISLSAASLLLPANANITAPNGVNLSAERYMTINSNVSTTNSNIKIVGGTSLGLSGAINAGTGTVAIQPEGYEDIGLNGGIGPFQITAGMLAHITAGTLQIGDGGIDWQNPGAGSIYQAGTIDLSGPGPAGVYNLVLISGNYYGGAGSTTILGSKSFSVTSITTTTTGTIIGGSGTISITNSFAFGIRIGGSATESITSSGPIYLNIGGDGGGNFISGPGTVRTTGTLNISLGLTSGPSVVNAAIGALSATGTHGDLTVNQSGNIILNGGISLGQGALTVNAASGNVHIGVMAADTVAANGGINITVQGANTISGRGTLQSTGTLTVNLGNSGSSLISTAVSSLSGIGSGAALTVNQTGNLTLNSGISYGTGSLTVTATGGSVTIGSAAGDTILANGGLSLSADGGISGAGTLVSTGIVSLASASGNIGGNASATTTLTINGAGSGLSLFVNAPQIGGSGGTVNVSDVNGETVTVLNGSFAGNTMTLVSDGAIKIVGSVSAQNNVTFTTAGAQITSVYPSDLDLSETTPNLTIPQSGNTLVTVDSGSQLASTTGAISINGQVQASSTLGPGSYGPANYSVTIAVGTSGSLIITPSTLVTPAEWIAAIEVQNTSSQPLQIGTNNAASGGTFNISAANIPSGAFSSIVIPNSPYAVTAYISSSSLPTNSLVNNGIIQASGSQTNIAVTSAGTSTGNLQLGGSGSFITSSGTLTLQSSGGNSNSLTLDAGTNFVVTGALSLVSPNIIVGSSGTSTATLAASGGNISIQPSVAGSGSLNFSSGGSSSSLTLTGAPVMVSTTSGTSLGTDFNLIATTSLAVSNTSGGSISTAVGSAFSAPSVSLTTTAGNIGTNTPVFVNSGGTGGLTLFVSATKVAGNGGTINISDTNSEAITLANNATPLSASIAFTLSANGNILASVSGNTAIVSPSISLTATGGNIGANASATNALLVNSGNTSGLLLFTSATQIASNGGNVNVVDNTAEAVSLATGTFASNTLQLTVPIFFTALGTVSAGGNIDLTTLGSQQLAHAFPTDLSLDQTVPALTIPAGASIDLVVNSGGQVHSTGGAISINGQPQANVLAPGSYGAPNYSVTISGGPTGTLTITPTTLVTPAEWVAAIQVQDTASQPLTIGANNAASGGSFTLTAANVPAGGFTNIVIPATTPGTTMTVSTPVQTNSLTNNGSIQGSIVQIFSNGNLSIGGNGTIQSTVGTTIQSGGSNDVNFTGGTLTFRGATEVFSGTGNLNQIFLQTGAGFAGANAVTLYTDKVAGDTGNISGNPLKIVPYSGAGTIANPSGDVVLPSNLIFAGKDLAILASGNIKAKSTVTSINLSTLSGNGGSLIMAAGFDFQDTSVPTTTLDPLFKTRNQDTWMITGPSPSGGSVLLPKVAINTSSAANGNAGNITVVAHAGNNSAGAVQLGNITATANTKTGIGGSVTLIGQGGVQTGFIKTSGAIGNSVTIEAAAPTPAAGSVEIVDGDRVGLGFTWLTPLLTDGGAVLVSGLINSAGANGRGGDILIDADFQIQVKSSITATGLFTANNLIADAGGDVQIQSLLSSVSIASSINTSALARDTAVGGAAGDAGSMYISAESYVSTGSLLAKGANNLGAGSGGTGGNILLTTSMITGTGTPADGYRFGNVKVTGYITVQGGNVSATLGDTNSTGGNSGGVAVDAGTFIVTSNSGGVSINDRPGWGRQSSNNGTVGGVDIHTYGIQQLPSRLDLTSTLANIASLPGAMFTVGLVAPVNGTQGTIAVDSLTVGSDNFTSKLLTGGGPIPGEITQNTSNGSATIRVSIMGPALPVLFAPIVLPSGGRGMLNPSQAAAEFQNDRGQTPITLLNQVASSGTITVDQSDINGTTLSAFKLPAGVTLSVTGSMPILNMPASTLINGTLSFATTGSIDYINLGSGALTIGSSGAGLSPTATIDASNSTLIISGTASTWSNNANLVAGTLVLARPTTSALTFVTGLGASTQASEILLGPEMDTSMSISFKSNGAAQWNTGGATPHPIPVVFGTVTAPAVYKSNAASNGLNTALPLVKLTFALSEENGNTLVPMTATVGGQINASSITISGTPSTVILSGVAHTVQTAVSLEDGAKLTSSTAINVSTPAGMTVGNGTQLTAATALQLNAGGVLTLGNGNILTAGLLSSTATPYGTGVLLSSQIVKNGSIVLSGSGSSGNNGVFIGDNNQFSEMGSKLNITAKLGNLQIGDSNLFLDRGGNVIVLAKGNIIGGAGNQFESQGVLNTASGGVEIGAGTTTSLIGAAFSKPSGTRLGIGNIQGINDLSPTHGAIVLNTANATGVNMAVGGLPQMNVDLGNGGVAVFDAQGNSTVQMQSGGLIQTQASKPVSLVFEIEQDREFVVDTDLDAI